MSLINPKYQGFNFVITTPESSGTSCGMDIPIVRKEEEPKVGEHWTKRMSAEEKHKYFSNLAKKQYAKAGRTWRVSKKGVTRSEVARLGGLARQAKPVLDSYRESTIVHLAGISKARVDLERQKEIIEQSIKNYLKPLEDAIARLKEMEGLAVPAAAQRLDVVINTEPVRARVSKRRVKRVQFPKALVITKDNAGTHYQNRELSYAEIAASLIKQLGRPVSTREVIAAIRKFTRRTPTQECVGSVLRHNSLVPDGKVLKGPGARPGLLTHVGKGLWNVRTGAQLQQDIEVRGLDG